MSEIDRKRGEAIGLHPLAIEPICDLYDDLVDQLGPLNDLQRCMFVCAAKLVNAICKAAKEA